MVVLSTLELKDIINCFAGKVKGIVNWPICKILSLAHSAGNLQ